MRIIRVFVPVIIMISIAGWAYAGGNTAFNYQGRLLDGGQPANGLFDFEFSLWDAEKGGSQIGLTQIHNAVPVADDLFSLQIDFGADAFDNADRWLSVTVNTVLLSPRQPVTRVPYSIQTRGIVVNADQHVAMGVSPGSMRFRAWNSNGGAIEAVSTGRAIEAFTTEGDRAIFALNQAADGMAVFAEHQPTQNQAWLGTPDYGVYGQANDVDNDWAGYFLGRAHVSDTLFVGREDPITGSEFFGFNAPVGDGIFGGMYITTNSESARPYYGYAAGGTEDVFHFYDGITGKWQLWNGGDVRLTVQSNGNVGIGTTAPISTLHVRSTGTRAIYASNTNTDTGFFYGVYASSDSPTGRGVYGLVGAGGQQNYGVYGQSLSSAGYGVFSNGDCHVLGTLSKFAGSFKIDHPLDPENKYLQHSFVESPDMMNVYNGNVILDENGKAYVGLPDYFDVLNRDFRYQLTPMGAAMPNLHIGQEIANNSFRIAGGKAGMKVSWQVTGIRQDRWAEAHRIEVEPYKRPEHQGKYLSPKLYGRPKEMGVHYFPDAERPVAETALAKAQAGQTPNPSTGELK